MKKRILSTLLALCMVLTLLPGAAQAISFEDMLLDAIQPKTSYDVSGGKIYFNLATGTICGADRTITEAIIPNSIEGVAVTSIGYDAFGACTKLTNIVIPESVTTIGETALRGCAFSTITIPNSVTTIGDGAFKACTNLTSISIPDSVISIGSSAFKDCSSLTSISIPDSVTSIGAYAFELCTNLTSVTIADSVTSIGGYAFRCCYLLENIKLPAGLDELEEGLFYHCYLLDNVVIPEGVTEILLWAFGGCISLKNITVPASVTRLMSDVFAGCSSLTDINYTGTGEQWATLGGPAKQLASSITIHYNSPVPNSPVISSQQPTTDAPSAQKATASPTSSAVLVNGENIAFDAYNIGGSNYFKLRDLAYVLSGSDKQFEVSWDAPANAITLTSGQPYTAVGGELGSKGAGAQAAALTTSKVLLNGEEVKLTAYNIGGNNYFKLRNIGEIFDFGVDWDNNSKTIVINTAKGYSAD